MRILTLFIFLISLSTFVNAQKISDIYRNDITDFSKIHHRNIVTKAGLESDTVREISNLATKQYKYLQHLFNDYKIKTAKDLEKSSLLYLLESTAISLNSSVIIIWNKTDTLFNKTELIAPIKNIDFSRNKGLSFTEVPSDQREYFLKIMNFLSKTKEDNLINKIKEKTVPQDKLLDGASYKFYIFKKKRDHYLTNQYSFSNLIL